MIKPRLVNGNQRDVPQGVGLKEMTEITQEGVQALGARGADTASAYTLERKADATDDKRNELARDRNAESLVDGGCQSL